MATEQITQKEASNKNMTVHTTSEPEKSPKRTVLYRYNEAKGKANYDHNQFCGLILAEHLETAKDAISRCGKLWAKADPSFPKSDKAFDTIEEELTNHVKAMVSQLRSGSTKVVANLVPVTF